MKNEPQRHRGHREDQREKKRKKGRARFAACCHLSVLSLFFLFCLLGVLCVSVVNLRRNFVMRCVLVLLAILAPAVVRAADPVPKPVNDRIKEVAGTAEYLRS